MVSRSPALVLKLGAVRHRGHKAIAVAGNGLDESMGSAVVPERLAEMRNHNRQSALRKRHVRPEESKQFILFDAHLG